MTTTVTDRYVDAPTLSEGWLGAMAAVSRTTRWKAVHLLVRIADPTVEVHEIRQAAEGLIAEVNRGVEDKRQKPAVETTRNTIFPASWARRMPEPADLAAYYRERYTKDGGLRSFSRNGRGTYFGRIVAYPRFGDDDQPADQLTETVRKLRAEFKTGAPKSSRYEINIFNERCDTSPMSFPCLAHLSVHLEASRLHMQAIYRNEYLVARGYGNFLGLAQLQTYVAAAVGLGVGELLMTMGHAEIDANKTPTRNALGDLWESVQD